MAAHLKTGVEQVLQDLQAGKLNKLHIESACNLSCWTEDDWDTWQHLYKWVIGELDFDTLKAKLEDDLARATEQWEKFGQPRTREAWHRAKYQKESS